MCVVCVYSHICVFLFVYLPACLPGLLPGRLAGCLCAHARLVVREREREIDKNKREGG